MSAPLLVLAAGGTGGHMFPAQALAEVMLARGWRVELSTDARGARYVQGFPPEVTIRQVKAATTARGGFVGKLTTPFILSAGLAATVLRWRKQRPTVVVGFGGYPSIPALAAALVLRIPRMIHESNGVLGRVNQRFATRVDRVACGVWPTEVPTGTKAWHCGSPVRAQVLDRARSPYIPPGDYPMSLLVMGGSQGARILSDIVPKALALLPPRLRDQLRVAHQARAEDQARVADFYAAQGIRAEVEPFFGDVARRLTEAQLVITRSGASTLADLTVIGRPAILVPLASAIRDEQSANGRALVAEGAASLLTEPELTPERLAAEVTAILSDPARALAMSQAAARLGIPDATERLADMVEELAKIEKNDARESHQTPA